jgi:transcription elongation factor S-II
MSNTRVKIANPDQFRLNVRSKLDKILQNENYALNLEKGIYNYALKEATNRKVVKKWDNAHFVQIYVDHLRSIYINLQNKELVGLLQKGDMKPHEIAFMTHQEMRPDIWKELIEAKTKKDMAKYESTIEASTDTFTCRKCKQNKCTFYLQQLRSADEPMTCFVQCVNCGNRWKC